MQNFGKFVESCLRQAEKEGITSIAFPSIGNGYLRYPVEAVARTMFQTVQKFAAERNDGCLKEVSFVIYYKDHKSLQVIKPINTPFVYFGLIGVIMYFRLSADKRGSLSCNVQ